MFHFHFFFQVSCPLFHTIGDLIFRIYGPLIVLETILNSCATNVRQARSQSFPAGLDHITIHIQFRGHREEPDSGVIGWNPIEGHWVYEMNYATLMIQPAAHHMIISPSFRFTTTSCHRTYGS